MLEARRRRLAKERAARIKSLSKLNRGNWTIPCVLCGDAGPVGKMIRKPDIRICKTCWATLTLSRKAAIVEAIDRI